MVSEKEIFEAFNLYLSEENLELYDLNIIVNSSISSKQILSSSPGDKEIANLHSKVSTFL